MPSSHLNSFIEDESPEGWLRSAIPTEGNPLEIVNKGLSYVLSKAVKEPGIPLHFKETTQDLLRQLESTPISTSKQDLKMKFDQGDRAYASWQDEARAAIGVHRFRGAKESSTAIDTLVSPIHSLFDARRDISNYPEYAQNLNNILDETASRLQDNLRLPSTVDLSHRTPHTTIEWSKMNNTEKAAKIDHWSASQECSEAPMTDHKSVQTILLYSMKENTTPGWMESLLSVENLVSDAQTDPATAYSYHPFV